MLFLVENERKHHGDDWINSSFKTKPLTTLIFINSDCLIYLPWFFLSPFSIGLGLVSTPSGRVISQTKSLHV